MSLDPSRRQFILVPLAAPAVAQPRLARPLRFVPNNDLVTTDPHLTPAYVTRNHAQMVFDTLYGLDDRFGAHPQMIAGDTVSADGLEWRLTLRPGLRFHDGEPVRARDCVASIRRWARRDSFGEALLSATAELSAWDDMVLRFRLHRPFPRLRDALGKAASIMPAILPERLAETEPTRPIPEIIGSGPYQFLRAEHIPGARAAYERFDGYLPRPDGPAERTAGPKRALLARVEWTVIRDPVTASTALARGEQDWWEFAAQDQLGWLARQPGIRTSILDDTGMVSMAQPNHLHPPFDNVDIRRALLRALDQQAFARALAGDDSTLYRLPLGVYAPGSPLADAAGLEALTGPRDPGPARDALRAAGQLGRTVVILSPGDFVTGPMVGQILASQLRELGLVPDLQVMDQASLLRRRTNRAAPEQGGWNLFTTAWSGMDWLNPASHLPLRGNGTAYPGWAISPEREALRDAWFAADTPSREAEAARALQAQAMRDVPFLPLCGYAQASAYRAALTGMRRGFPVFWGLDWQG